MVDLIKENINNIYSWDLAETFYNYSLQLDLKKGFKLVNQCFDNFPKDIDSITNIILQGLEDSTNIFEEKLYFNTLIIYLKHLYLEWLKNHA